MAMTDAEMLEQVEAAIQAILTGGQSYKIGQREFTKADLKTLFDKQKELQVSIGEGTYGTRTWVEWGTK